MIEVKETLIEEDYKDALYVNWLYNAKKKHLKALNILLLVIMTLSVLLNWTDFQNGDFSSLIYLVFGFSIVFVFSFPKLFLFKKYLKSIRSNKNFNKEITYRFDEEGNVYHQWGSEEGKASLLSYYGYYESKSYIVLLPQKMLINVIKKECMDEQAVDQLVALLEDLNIPKIYNYQI